MPVDDYQIGLFSCRDRADALGAAETKNRSFAAVNRTTQPVALIFESRAFSLSNPPVWTESMR
jgi:hypothetical protein